MLNSASDDIAEKEVESKYIDKFGLFEKVRYYFKLSVGSGVPSQ